MDTTHESLLTGRDPRLLRAVTISALAHVVVLGLAFYLGSMASSAPILQTKPIVAHLVRLGTPRDPKLLPRKYRQPPPPRPQVALPVKKPPSHKPPPKPKVKPKTDKRSVDPLAAAISKVADQWDDKARPEKPPGAADGNPNGDAVTASEGDKYLALVEQQLHSNYKVPSTISDRQRLYLNATVVIYVAPDGHITRSVMEKSSGNAAVRRRPAPGHRRLQSPAAAAERLAGQVHDRGPGREVQALILKTPVAHATSYPSSPSLALVLGLATARPARADRVYIDVTGATFRPYPLAIPRVLSQGDAAAKVADLVTARLRYDLDVSGVFQVLDPRSFLATPGEGLNAASIKFPAWADVGAEGLLKGRITVKDGMATYEAHLFDVAKAEESAHWTYTARWPTPGCSPTAAPTTW